MPDGIKAPDPYTITFTTKKPVVELPVLITNKFTNIVPDGATHEELRLHEDGTGPFMQEQFTPNAPVRILKKNPNYWDAGKPKADCLRITVAQEAVAAVAPSSRARSIWCSTSIPRSSPRSRMIRTSSCCRRRRPTP